ncbi:hypothetical protein NBRC110019_19740 [Neptunitalea chrysea]|uniref:HTH luxR-type domain-containing protein n=1 Tax=Neptunitalea chrysea TaxID=1647581 RepID=A0A9W6B7Y2_9FLAO|nr:LuxR C-terminal-related transcriptional regulator [Neptunitalea chrysea]GLB52934.1 hypothetical protein NBRC110019_19740 [Neptunitalea chrysea]
MNTEDRSEAFKKIFIDYEVETNEVVKETIQRMKQIDKIIPPIETFFASVNILEYKFEYLSKNIEHNLGYTVSEMHENGGVLYLLSKIHPNDAPLLLKAIDELMKYITTKIPADKRDKISCSYNYRIKKKDGTYINILEHISPEYFNKDKIPLFVTSFYTVNGSKNEYPIVAIIKILNEKNGYETLYYKNYSTNSIVSKLTNREIDIVRLLTLSKTSKEIGDILFISSHTVDKHRRNILKKMNFKSTGEIVQYYKDNFIS